MPIHSHVIAFLMEQSALVIVNPPQRAIHAATPLKPSAAMETDAAPDSLRWRCTRLRLLFIRRMQWLVVMKMYFRPSSVRPIVVISYRLTLGRPCNDSSDEKPLYLFASRGSWPVTRSPFGWGIIPTIIIILIKVMHVGARWGHRLLFCFGWELSSFT